MYASIRRYTGVDPRMLDQLQQLRGSLEAAFRGVSGFRSWYLVRTDEGIATVTWCDDRAGAEASAQVARNFIQENLADMIPNPPEVSNGEVALQIGG